MKTRPILFSGPMVRALLDGRKTQTRRVMKHPLAQAAVRIHSHKKQSEFDCVLSDETGGIIHCPYGAPGDRLRVRETWGTAPAWDVIKPSELPIGSEPSCDIYFRADARADCPVQRWRPSIFLPQEGSRLTLEITAVRVERLQDISEADAKAEGIEFRDDIGIDRNYKFYGRDLERLNQWTPSPCWSYQTLWESINGEASWDANPWVWVIEFNRIEATP